MHTVILTLTKFQILKDFRFQILALGSFNLCHLLLTLIRIRWNKRELKLLLSEALDLGPIPQQLAYALQRKN